MPKAVPKKVAAKTRVKRPVIPVPQDRSEADEFLRQIADEQRTIERIQGELNAQVDQLKKKAVTDTHPHEARIQQLVEGIYIFAEANQEELTESGKRRTVELPSGTFGWRLTPPAVTIRNYEIVLESLRALGLMRFIRTEETVDKAAMLRDPEVAKTVEGVSVVQREEFVVRPKELTAEIVSSTARLKKALA